MKCLKRKIKELIHSAQIKKQIYQATLRPYNSVLKALTLFTSVPSSSTQGGCGVGREESGRFVPMWFLCAVQATLLGSSMIPTDSQWISLD